VHVNCRSNGYIHVKHTADRTTFRLMTDTQCASVNTDKGNTHYNIYQISEMTIWPHHVSRLVLRYDVPNNV